MNYNLLHSFLTLSKSSQQPGKSQLTSNVGFSITNLNRGFSNKGSRLSAYTQVIPAKHRRTLPLEGTNRS